MHILTKELIFPSPDFADEEGLLAFGGDLSIERLLLAYRNGIFPWFSEDEPICWWCPDPRFVLFPDELKISKSMRTVLNTGTFKFTINKAFDKVIRNCQKVSRKDQPGTWITDEVLEAYNNLHKAGYAHSAEAWKNGELVGGLYGVKLGKVFFGESMFSEESNASKFAFIKFVEHLKKQDVELIDCQVYTEHLESLGARMIERKDFLQMLTQLIN
jgi:leucyl/phenylalanyl-tRNA--protein transferase